jgi:hypothetical protein
MSKKLIAEKTLSGIFQQDPEGILAFIQKKVAQLKKLNQIWQEEIAEDLAAHSRIANFRDGHLIIECDSAAWATRLRYMLPEIRQKLRQYPDLQDLSHIEWSIQPHFHSTTSQSSRQPPLLSPSSAQLLKNTATSIKGKPLKEALQRISKN